MTQSSKRAGGFTTRPDLVILAGDWGGGVLVVIFGCGLDTTVSKGLSMHSCTPAGLG